MVAAETWFDWSSLFLFSGIINALIAGLFIAQKLKIVKKSSSLLWLTLLMLCVVILLNEQLLRNSVLLYLFPQFLFWGSPFLFLYLPLILFYYKSVLKKNLTIWPHLILPAFMFTIMFPTYRMNNTEKLKMFEASDAQDPYWIIILYLMYFLFYSIKILGANRELRRLVKNESTDNRIDNYETTNNVIAGMSLLALVFPVACLFR